MREAKSFCRICAGFCGMVLSLDSNDRIVAVRGDKGNPHSRGFACIKGLQAPAAHNGEQRLLHPLKRTSDGALRRIALEDAIGEIAEALGRIVDRDGPAALAAFRGTINVFSAASSQMVSDFLSAFGSSGFYSTMTIDQSAKWVTAERLGIWGGGGQAFANADVWLWAGINPLVSLSNLSNNPALALKEAKARGLKLIVIDPRRTETARHADLFLQPRPGEDVAIAAGLLHIVLANGWHDHEFCERYVEGLDELRAAVAPVTPDRVAAQAGIDTDGLRLAARMFARDGRRGMARAGTGVCMAPHSNLADHLYECLNVVCGRYLREGEAVPNPGVLGPAYPIRAEVIGPFRSWEQSERSRIGGYGMLFGEKMTGVLADEILTPGEGRVRALVVDGGNPASAVPDQHKFVRAMRDLELLVTIDPYLTTTARLAHYILPPTVFYEHTDMAPPAYETALFGVPYAAYTDAVSAVPEGADIADDWLMLFKIAQRAGRAITFRGVELDMSALPTSDLLHGILCSGGRLTLEQLRANAGKIVPLEPVKVDEGSGHGGKFAVAPPDVVEELATVVRRPHLPASAGHFTHRLISRRLREVSNSMYHDLPAVRRRLRYNPAYMNPDDLSRLALASGDRVSIASDHGRIDAIVEADADIRPGTISMAHSWGGLPGEADYSQVGAYTGLLISTDRNIETINAMPRQTAIPVRIEPCRPSNGDETQRR